MMYEIKITNPCSCARKRKAWSKELVFDTLDEARVVADKMCVQGNEKFCKRDSFSAGECDGATQIVVQPKR